MAEVWMSPYKSGTKGRARQIRFQNSLHMSIFSWWKGEGVSGDKAVVLAWKLTLYLLERMNSRFYRGQVRSTEHICTVALLCIFLCRRVTGDGASYCQLNFHVWEEGIWSHCPRKQRQWKWFCRAVAEMASSASLLGFVWLRGCTLGHSLYPREFSSGWFCHSRWTCDF